MKCMRCGRDLKEDGHVFWPACREYMDTCPVPPGTPIQLPQQVEAAANRKKASKKKKEVKPEEQIAKLRFSNRWLTFALVVTVLAFAVTALVLFHTLDKPETPIGRNYSTVGQTNGE